MPHSETAKIRQHLWPWIEEGRGIDLGCGFDKVHPRCIGMDATRTPAVDVVGDITDLSAWDDGEFDWVFSSHAIEDIPDTEGAFREWLRVLRPDGTFIVYCPYRHYYPNVGQPGANPDHVHDFVPSGLTAALKAVDPDIWIVTAEVRGHKRTDEFHEYSCLVIARKGRPERPAVFIENNHQIGDTMSTAPLCGMLRDVLPGCEITVATDKAGVLALGTADKIGREDKAYDLIVHQRTSATERGDWLRRATHFTQFTARVCGQTLPEVIAVLPADPQEPLLMPYGVEDEDFHGLPELPETFVAVAMDTYPPRRWAHQKWTKLIGWLLDSGMPVVVIGTNTVDAVDKRVIDLRSRTTFRQAVAALSSAKALVSVDTSFAHVAHSLGVSCAVLMGPSAFRTTFYGDTIPIWRRDSGCIGCYNWASDDKWAWHDGTAEIPSGEPLREGQQMPMYERGGCSDFMSGVECMSAIRLSDAAETVGKMLGITPPARRGLTAAYIVLNEEDNLPRSLDAVVGLADAVVVVDTGSTDRTVEFANDWSKRTSIPLKVAEFEWCDDFAAAKNFAVEQVETSHFIWLDADDIVENPSAVRDVFDSTDHDVYHLLTDLGSGRFRRERIAPASARWLYPIHECLDIRGLDGMHTDLVVLHRPTEAKHWIGSLKRNEGILKVWLEREPESDRATFYLAETLRQRGDWDAAAPLYERHHARGTDWREALFHSAYQMARYRLHTKEWSEAVRWGLEAIRTDPAWREGYYVVGDAHFWMGDYTTAYAWFIATHNLPRPDRSLWKEEAIYSYLPATQLSYCCERSGNLDGAISWAEDAAKAGGNPARADELRRRQ